MRLTLTGAALTALAITSGSALAGTESRILQQSGNWRSMVTRNHTGDPMCVMASFGTDRQGYNMSMMIKYQNGINSGNSGVFVQLFKTGGWQFPKNEHVKVPLEIWFDKAHLFDVDASGYMTETGSPIVEFILTDLDMVANFMNGFRDGNMLYFRFRAGNEGFWYAPLSGSRIVANSFGACVGEVQKVKQPTQPWNGPEASPSQPSTPPTPPWASGTKPAAKKGDGSI
jgi:hypothetical protein